LISITGTNHGSDSVTQQAKTDLIAAYDWAAGEVGPSPVVADLGGQTLTSGVYNNASTLGLTGTLTLDGEDNPDAVFVFQAGSSLTTAPSSRVSLINGAQACNVYWQIGSSATLDTDTSFVGTIIALTSITILTRASVEGRLLAREGDVTMDTNTINRPTCAPSPPPPDTTVTDTAATTAATTTEAATTTAATTEAATTEAATTEAATTTAATTAAATTTAAVTTTPTAGATTTAATLSTPATPSESAPATTKAKPTKAAAVKRAKAAAKPAAPKRPKASAGGSTSTSRGFARPPKRHPSFTG
jgi:hypothetical protein